MSEINRVAPLNMSSNWFIETEEGQNMKLQIDPSAEIEFNDEKTTLFQNNDPKNKKEHGYKAVFKSKDWILMDEKDDELRGKLHTENAEAIFRGHRINDDYLGKWKLKLHRFSYGYELNNKWAKNDWVKNKKATDKSFKEKFKEAINMDKKDNAEIIIKRNGTAEFNTNMKELKSMEKLKDKEFELKFEGKKLILQSKEDDDYNITLNKKKDKLIGRIFNPEYVASFEAERV